MIELLTSAAFVSAAVPPAVSVLATIAVMEWRLRRTLGRAIRAESVLAPADLRSCEPPAVAPPPGVQAISSAVPPASAPRVQPATAADGGHCVDRAAGTAGTGTGTGIDTGTGAATGLGGPLAASGNPVQPRIYMGDRDHIIEFMRWFAADDYFGKYPYHEWVRFYHDWAADRSISPIPERRFLTLLGKVQTIKVSRERTKDRDGHVIRNGAGTPLRVTYYEMPRPPPDACKDERPRLPPATARRVA